MNAKLALAIGILVLGIIKNSIAQTWTQTIASTNLWSAVACSADGTTVYAAAGGYNQYYVAEDAAGLRQIYASTNSGLTWTTTGAPSNYWANIACSANGMKIMAVAVNEFTGIGGLYTSMDGGNTWVSNNIAPKAWTFVACSANGSRLFANTFSASFPSLNILYASTNFGTNWSALVSNTVAVACSADGTKLLMTSATATNSAYCYFCTSSNAGATWQTNFIIGAKATGFGNHAIALSADGNSIAIVVADSADLHGGVTAGSIMVSTNFGATWTTNNTFPWSPWRVAVSADGSKMIAAGYVSGATSGGPIYTSTNSGQTWYSNSVPPSVWRGLCCSADGNTMTAVSPATNLTSFGFGKIWNIQSLPAPTLNITLANGLQLAWTVPATNFVLQQNADMATTNWSVVTNVPVLNLTNLQNQVTLPVSSSNCYFRLSTP
jgi:hypothetical protein